MDFVTTSAFIERAKLDDQSTISNFIAAHTMSRRSYNSEFKLQVVLAALKSSGTDAAVAGAYDVPAVTLSNWKAKIKESGARAFENGNLLKEKKKKIARLEQIIGQKEAKIDLLQNL